jgi:hypothetical protein
VTVKPKAAITQTKNGYYYLQNTKFYRPNKLKKKNCRTALCIPDGAQSPSLTERFLEYTFEFDRCKWTITPTTF